MKDVIYQEAETTSKRVKVGMLIYTGAGDPVKHLNEAVSLYVGNTEYNEFIDANMDNPWIRVIIKGINDMGQTEFNPEIHRL
ncbi:MAG TPA: hypothetical protein VMV32_07470 [Ignavibacteriaceae bacterium]|nr:hypothetical protein [Ignavibacteriaceae bacterium]